MCFFYDWSSKVTYIPTSLQYAVTHTNRDRRSSIRCGGVCPLSTVQSELSQEKALLELRTNLLLAYPIAHLGYSPRACGGTGTANTINLANSAFTDVDLDCTVSKESWCLLLVKNHLISQAKTFTGEQVFWGWRVWPSCLHGMSQSIYWLYVWPLFQASRNAILHICIRLFQLPPCRKRK